MHERIRTLVLAGLLAAAALPARAQSPAEAELATVHNYLQISEQLSTSGQIAYDQVEALKEAGYEVVVNLGTASEDANALEGFLVTQQGMTYIQIPVSWSEPSLRDLQLFFDVMEANRDRKVYVHCFANMRVSAFVYLYRTLVQGIAEEEAREDLEAIWDPTELAQWAALIERAKQQHAGSK